MSDHYDGLKKRAHDDSAMVHEHVALITENRARSLRNEGRVKEVETKQDDLRERLPPVEAATKALAQLPERFIVVEANVRANKSATVISISVATLCMMGLQIILSIVFGGG